MKKKTQQNPPYGSYAYRRAMADERDQRQLRAIVPEYARTSGWPVLGVNAV